MAGAGRGSVESGLDRGLQWALEHELDPYLESGRLPGDPSRDPDPGLPLPWQHHIGEAIAPPGSDEPIFGRQINAFLQAIGLRAARVRERRAKRRGKPPRAEGTARGDATAQAAPRQQPREDRSQAEARRRAIAYEHRIPQADQDRWRFRDHLTGIVMVHGIGPQLAGQTLLDWTGPIITLIRDATAADAVGDMHKQPILAGPEAGLHGIDDPVFRANIDFSGETFPVVQVRIPWRADDLREATADYDASVRLYDRGQGNAAPVMAEGPRWIFTETWWASEVRPPTLRTMVAWLGEQGGIARIVQGIQQNTFGGGGLQFLARISVLPFVSVIASFAMVLLIVGLAITRFIPIEAIRTAATLKLASAFLTDWFGGARTLLRDPAQSANVRNRLVTTIKALRAYGCERVVIVAHSGGTIVSLTTLTDPAFPKLEVDKLITIGEALNLGWRLEAEDPDAPDPVPPKGNRMLGDLTIQPRLLWRDFFGTHDPASAGPPVPPVPAMRQTNRFTTERVYNRMSIVGDHGAYWTNDEQFLIPLIREIDVPNGSRRKSRFYRDSVEAFVRARRKERLSFLTLLRRGTSTLPIMAILAGALVTARGMFPLIGDAAIGVLRSIPFSKELGELGTTMSSWGSLVVAGWRPFDEMYGIGIDILLAALLFAVFQSLIPSRARGLWRRRKWWQLTALLVDVGVGPGAFVVVMAGWWATVNLGFGAIWELLVHANVFSTLGFVLVIVLLAKLGTFLRSKLRTSSSTVLRVVTIGFSAVFLAGMLAVLSAATLGLILVYTGSANRPDSDATRSFLVGAIVVLGLFNVLQRVGEWRWDVWDARERFQLRRRPLVCPGRGWSILIATLLSALGVAAAVAVAIGTPAVFPGPSGRETVFWGLIVAVIVLCAVTIAKDVVDNDVDESGRLVGTSGPGYVQPKPTGPTPPT